MWSRSPGSRSLLVAWASKAIARSSGPMPAPSSLTRTSWMPPSSRSMRTWLAPASSAFSTSSLTTDAGRSMTSPAAIWLRTTSGRSAMRGAVPWAMGRL